jgi:tetratricopeptide (TPR) repeat protein
MSVIYEFGFFWNVARQPVLRSAAIWAALVFCGSDSAWAQSSNYLEARARYERKEYLAAMLPARKAVEEDGRNAAYRHLYGAILTQLGQFRDAKDHLRIAVEIEPENAEYQYSWGLLLLQMPMDAAVALQLASGVRQPRMSLVDPEGVKALERAVRIDPKHLQARLRLGRAYYDLNRHDLAREQFQAVLQGDPRYPWVHSHLAVVYTNAGAVQDAIRELNTELRLYPDHTSARLELGEALIKTGQFREALEQLQLALKNDPQMESLPDMNFALAKAYRGTGRANEAVKAARRCIELKPGFADAHYLLAQLYLETGQRELALEQMEKFRNLRNP